MEALGFRDLKITAQFVRALEERGIEHPTAVQVQAIPPILAGQDVVAIAPTGTGKTLAYGLPILQKLKFAQGAEPRALVLVPTKELVVQVCDMLLLASENTDLRVVPIYGGIGPRDQLARVAAGCDVLVATPGRFLDLYSRGGIPVKQLKIVVLDEADRMMEMGFVSQLQQIQEVLPRKKQQILLSATFPQRVERLCEEFLLHPVRVEVAPQATAVDTVRQVAYPVPNYRTRLALLLHLLSDKQVYSRVLIFARTRSMCEDLASYLARSLGEEVRAVHGNKGQNSRFNAVEAFSRGDSRLLVATDVASRGLDITDVTHVINVTVPRTYNDYVHRIGRTGRAFRTGTAITLFDPSEAWHLAKIEELIREKIPRLALPPLGEHDYLPDELQTIRRAIDLQRKKDDPTYQGAFHERKKKRFIKKKNK